jgi:CRISPR/Cas system-associated endonuclease/helicase Cas3
MPFDIHTRTAGLATDAFAQVTAFFAGTSHRPSQEQWDAIHDLLDHLEQAALGDLERAVYLSSIPAGTGKTTALVKFAETLMDNPIYADTGMLITVNRITEAEDMAKTLGQHRAKLCVIISST